MQAALPKIIASLVAGLGLFFLGLHLVGNHLKQASSRRFRSLIARFTDRVWRGSLLGLLAGVFMQSTSAVAVILASMAASGLVTVRQALPIVLWTNVGTALIVFVGVFDLELFALYCLGISATVFVFSGEVRWKPICGVLLGISLLFFGIHLMKTGTGNLRTFEWFQAVMDRASGSYLLAFAAGTLLSFLTQSTTAVALLAVTMAHAGLLRIEATMMLVYGGNLGSTFARMILGSGLKGSSRQIGHFQDLFKIGGSLLFAILFYVEVNEGVPLVKALATALSDRLEWQTALANLLCNLVPAVMICPLLGPMERLLDRLWPATAAEDFAKLKYLHPQALGDPETTIDLIEKEQMRLLTRLPEYVDALRPAENGKRRSDDRAMHQAFQMLFKEVQSYLASLFHEPLSRSTFDRLTNVQDRHGVIGVLEETVRQMVSSVEQAPPSAPLTPLVRSMTEALDFLLGTAGEALTTLDPIEADLLAGLCGDRGDLLERLRNLYLASEQGLSPPDKLLLLSLTTHFDRIVWVVRRLAALLQQNRRFRP
jgi:phosphate:Na+ symporter